MTPFVTSSRLSCVTSAIDLMPIAILVAESDGTVVGANAAWTELTGLDHQTSMGWGWSSAVAPQDQSRLLQNLIASDRKGNPHLGDHSLQVAGDHRWSRWTAHHFDDEPVVVIAVVDIDADRARVEDLRRAATLDSLTGLVNRAELLQVAAAALKPDPTAVGMCFVDLDAFKEVNDRAGHLLGDHVLAAAAARLAAAVRPSDVLARVGGDEFAVLLPDGSQASTVARRLSQALAEPILAGGIKWSVGATVGLAMGQPGQTAEGLLAAADRAMYAAKATSRNSILSEHEAVGLFDGMPIEIANDVIQRIFGVGLTLASASTMVHGDAADRLASAIDELDRIIARVRHSATEASPHAVPDTANPADKSLISVSDLLVDQISLLLAQLDDGISTVTRIDEQRTIHLLDASYSLHRALIDLTADTSRHPCDFLQDNISEHGPVHWLTETSTGPGAQRHASGCHDSCADGTQQTNYG